ncbi:hypothetical protein GOV14_04165 [Candidatus Pacearchaeota archaeon]|nr:hypothetical protein [Candidatus Pacearchaeota archaeon]
MLEKQLGELIDIKNNFYKFETIIGLIFIIGGVAIYSIFSFQTIDAGQGIISEYSSNEFFDWINKGNLSGAEKSTIVNFKLNASQLKLDLDLVKLNYLLKFTLLSTVIGGLLFTHGFTNWWMFQKKIDTYLNFILEEKKDEMVEKKAEKIAKLKEKFSDSSED